MAAVDRDGGDRHDQRQLRRREQRQRHAILPEREHAPVEEHRRRAADDEEEHEEDRHLRDAPTLANSASTSRRMPLTTKKNGMKKPNATAVSFESKSGTSRARRACRVIRPAANPPRSRSSPRSEASRASANTSTTIHRTASCELLSSVRSSIGIVRLGRAHGEHGDAHRERDERDEDDRVVQRALGREDQREQQDRPELADRPGREQVAAEVRLQLARVREDGDQRADRGRRQRGADIDERHDDAEGRQDAAERVGDHEREGPARQRQPQRLPADALRCRSRSRRRRTASRARGR